MASVKGIYECPRCDEPLTAAQRPTSCPKCKYDFGVVSDVYKYPVTLSEQLVRMKNKTAYYEAVLDAPIAKANDILTDALHIVQTLPAKNESSEGISYIVETAIKIGEIARSYREYLVAGGSHVPSLFIKQETQNGDKTGTGEKPT